MAILSVLLSAIIIIVSILLVLIVLVQRPKQEGLGAAFGGGAFDTALGAHTTDILQKITTYLAVIFFVSAIGLAMIKSRQFAESPANDVLEKVEKRDPELPAMPPSISDFPTDSPSSDSPLTPVPAINDAGKVDAPEETSQPADDTSAPATPGAADETPAPAKTKADAPAKTKAQATEKGKAKADTPAPTTPGAADETPAPAPAKAKADAPEKGKAKAAEKGKAKAAEKGKAKAEGGE